MSRIVAFNLRRLAVGEFRATVNRGYGLNGSIRLQGGMTSTVTLPTSALAEDWLQFGRMVMVHDEGELLPPWAGMIDPPWAPLLPVQATFYGLEYLMQQRTPDTQVVLTGTFESVLTRLVGMVNALSDLHIRMGDMGSLPSGSQQLTVKQTPLWGQINDFGKREGVEFLLRPTYEKNETLTIYLDAGQSLGVKTGVFLHDGKSANIKLLSASVEGPIQNRIIGIGKQDTQGSRPKTVPMTDADSISLYDLRSVVTQFSTLTSQSSLDNATRNALEKNDYPTLKLDVLIEDATIFPNCRLGNRFDLHVAELYLPGGIKGWRGPVRLTQMAYDEAQNTITATMTGLAYVVDRAG
jgi:hypothetical protein